MACDADALYLQGLAGDDDVLKELNKPDHTGIKLRAKAELWKKLGYLEPRPDRPTTRPALTLRAAGWIHHAITN